MRWPVIQRLPSPSSAAIAGPMSSATAIRPSAVSADRCSWKAGVSRTMPPLKSVATGPGAIVLTRMPRAPSSAAR